MRCFQINIISNALNIYANYVENIARATDESCKTRNQRNPFRDRLGQVLFDKTAAMVKLLPVNSLPWCCGKKPHFLFAEPWKGVGKKSCLQGFFCDSGDTPANTLCELNGHLMPCTNWLYGKWVEDVCTGQFGVFVYFVRRCLLGCCTSFSCCAANVGWT